MGRVEFEGKDWVEMAQTPRLEAEEVRYLRSSTIEDHCFYLRLQNKCKIECCKKRVVSLTPSLLPLNS